MRTVFAGTAILFVMISFVAVSSARAQSAPSAATRSAPATTALDGASDYVIGPEDVLGVLFWREQEMSGDVTVRPDGMITLPLLGDVKAAGLRPEALRDQVQKAAGRLLADSNVTVVVRQINSRKVFVAGRVAQPGAYPLAAPRTVLQMIALAGGLNEYADGEKISIIRTEQGRTRTLKFNYKDVSKGKKLEQNIQLQPGDTVVVP